MVRDGRADYGHGGVAYDEPEGVEVGSFETFWGDDGFDFAFGGEFGCIFGEGVVGGYPVFGCWLILGCLASFSHYEY
jgi:hypothetical protein